MYREQFVLDEGIVRKCDVTVQNLLELCTGVGGEPGYTGATGEPGPINAVPGVHNTTDDDCDGLRGDH